MIRKTKKQKLKLKKKAKNDTYIYKLFCLPCGVNEITYKFESRG